jgi:hypothetical protein
MLTELGIAYDDVVQVLEDQGVAAFDARWGHLGQRLASALRTAGVDVTILEAAELPRRPPSWPGPGAGDSASGQLSGCVRGWAGGGWLVLGSQVGDAQAGLCEWLKPVRGDRGPHPGQRALHQPEMQ